MAEFDPQQSVAPWQARAATVVEQCVIAALLWVLGKTAEANAVQRVNSALVQAYGTVRIERFKQQANVERKWAELAKIEAYRRDAYIQESGFATPPRSTLPNPAIADACADALSKVIAMQSPTAVN